MAIILCEDHTLAIEGRASAEYPHECCGFLIGAVDGDDRRVAQVRAAGNTRDDSPRNRFAIDPAELMRVDRTARREGLGVVGFYHSHPDAPAVPSGFDRERAWSGYSYLIVSVARGEPAEMNCWRLAGDETEFEPEEIRVETEA